MKPQASRIPALLKTHEKDLLADWVTAQLAAGTLRGDLLKETELREQSRNFLAALQAAAPRGDDINAEGWSEVREILADLSRSRALAGFSPSETATFVLSLKQPLFSRLRAELKSDPEAFGDEIWRATVLLDRLGLYTTELFLKSREDVIARQQAEMMELSTPVVELWDDILALPLVGTLDSARTQVVMETLLQKVVQTGAAIAIIDITGVAPTSRPRSRSPDSRRRSTSRARRARASRRTSRSPSRSTRCCASSCASSRAERRARGRLSPSRPRDSACRRPRRRAPQQIFSECPLGSDGFARHPCFHLRAPCAWCRGSRRLRRPARAAMRAPTAPACSASRERWIQYS